jgi:hypothetical protein
MRRDPRNRVSRTIAFFADEREQARMRGRCDISRRSFVAGRRQERERLTPDD